MKRDPLLVPPVPEPAVLERVRAAALAELRATPHVSPWRGRAFRVVVAVMAMTAAGAAVVGALNPGTPSLLAARAPALVLLLAAQALGLWAAMVPGRARVAGLSWALAAAGAAAVLWLRTGGGTGVSGWVCSVTHVAAALAPLAVVVWALKDGAWTWRRALTAGVALGTAGAVWGEITCQRGVAHVVLHHGGAWLIVAGACLVLSRLARPRSFVP